ncbi:hypothetical protein GCM10010371_12660 [Streptomyces subrutilus]|uniref:Uncharacterized protein n=1 Tax=Streptomyces subrutilus TaxID=36818 RepID=A0A918QLQ3_9ACTN|nr:hypothetical protein GCM10010371_12660 [Streptomyces subrutilus]
MGGTGRCRISWRWSRRAVWSLLADERDAAAEDGPRVALGLEQPRDGQRVVPGQGERLRLAFHVLLRPGRDHVDLRQPVRGDREEAGEAEDAVHPFGDVGHEDASALLDRGQRLDVDDDLFGQGALGHSFGDASGGDLFADHLHRRRVGPGPLPWWHDV